MGFEPAGKEGQQEGGWMVLDYRTVLVHLIHTEERDFYRLVNHDILFTKRIEGEFLFGTSSLPV